MSVRVLVPLVGCDPEVAEVAHSAGIAEFADSVGSDLIVMGCNRKSDLERWKLAVKASVS